MIDEAPPNRTESAEMTVVIPRDSLPPVSTIPGPTMAHLAEIKALSDAERTRRDEAQERETQMVCPWCQDGLVSPSQRSAWLAKYPELAADQPPPSQPEEPIPSLRPEPA